jgi:8-oxo-dGTP diphosphatase
VRETKAGTAVFVVRADGSFLLTRRAKPGPGQGLWSCPGGRIERGETWRECGVRETLEETGLAVAGPQLVAVTTTPGVLGWLTVWMRCSCQGGNVTLNDEASEYVWATCGELHRYPLWKPHWTPLLDEFGTTMGLERKLKEMS